MSGALTGSSTGRSPARTIADGRGRIRSAKQGGVYTFADLPNSCRPGHPAVPIVVKRVFQNRHQLHNRSLRPAVEESLALRCTDPRRQQPYPCSVEEVSGAVHRGNGEGKCFVAGVQEHSLYSFPHHRVAAKHCHGRRNIVRGHQPLLPSSLGFIARLWTQKPWRARARWLSFISHLAHISGQDRASGDPFGTPSPSLPHRIGETEGSN